MERITPATPITSDTKSFEFTFQGFSFTADVHTHNSKGGAFTGVATVGDDIVTFLTISNNHLIHEGDSLEAAENVYWDLMESETPPAMGDWEFSPNFF